MNKHQINKMLFKEALIVGTTGIILGIIIGIIFSILIINLIQSFITNFSSGNISFYLGIQNINILTNDTVKLQYIMSFKSLIITIIIVYIIVFISCMLPIKKKNKMSIIEAIKNVNKNKIKAKNIKIPLIISKIFGISRTTCI